MFLERFKLLPLGKYSVALSVLLTSLGSLGSLLLRLALELRGLAFGLHLLTADQTADSAFDLATDLLGFAFHPLAHIAHDLVL